MFVAPERVRASRPHSRELLAPPLHGGARVDACVIGAGLAGMVAAYQLARDGRRVMVVDEGPLGGVDDGFQAAHLASVVEKAYARLERSHGAHAARVAAQSHAAAIDALEAIVRREHIACDFERLDGYCFAGSGEEASALRRELDAARRAGVRGVEALPAVPLEGVPWSGCLRFPDQAQFHPTRFLAGLARAIVRHGGRIHCGVRARAIAAGRPVRVLTTAGHRIEADAVVTSHAVRADGRLEARPRAAIAHVVGLRVPRGAVPRALYWQASECGRWARLGTQPLQGGGELLLAGGEDPESDDDHTAYRYLALEDWARERFPMAGDVVQRFTGQVVPSFDVFALAGADGRDSESVCVAAGEWGTAMTRGVIAGIVVRDFVEHVPTPWADLYLPEACCTAAAGAAPGTSEGAPAAR